MAKSRLIDVSGLNDAIKNAVDEYNASVVDSMKRETENAMKELVSDTKKDAPVGKRKKHYRDKIASRTVNDTKYGKEMQWYVKDPDYRLTHLLEYGHAKRNGGRVEGTKFLSTNVNKIVSKYIKEVERIVENGK